MKRTLLALPLIALVAGCATQEQNTIAGAAAGGLVGAAVGDRNGALIGTAIGAVAGANANTGAKPSCVYTEADGSRYNAPCP